MLPWSASARFQWRPTESFKVFAKDAWLRRQDPTRGGSSNADRWWAFHWATLIQGAKLAWLADDKKLNRRVQYSVRIGLQKCTIYHTKMLDDFVDFYKEYGNLGNKHTQDITAFEIHSSTDIVEPGWKRHKSQMGWTSESVDQKYLDIRKLEFANGLYQDRWATYRHLELIIAFYQQSKKIVVPQAPGGPVFGGDVTGHTIWNVISSWMSQHADLGHPICMNHVVQIQDVHGVQKTEGHAPGVHL